MIAETANWFFSTVLINLLPDLVVKKNHKMVNLIKLHDAIIFHRVMVLYSCTGVA